MRDRRRRLWTTLVVALTLMAGLGAAGLLLVRARPDRALDLWRSTSLRLGGIEHGVVEAQGEQVSWARVGEGPPVILVHGLRGELTVTLPLARALAARGYSVICFDLPGHGTSPMPHQPLDIDRAGEIVLEAAARLGVSSRPALVGHSLGGWVVAWRALAEPRRCGPVVLVSSAGLPFELPELPLLLSRTARDARRSLPLLFAEPPRWVPRWLLWVAVQRPYAGSVQLLRAALSGRYLLDGLLRGMAPPALVIFGEQDRLIPPSLGRDMAAQIPGGRYVGVDRGGHMVIWERPDAVSREIDGFLREVGYGGDGTSLRPQNGSSGP